ncbi:hypothetical protein Btru_066814 [Bulinus truncatus]|nr:hypothetical protein Btru_066814 [Bulinus truncatus]
MSHVIPIVSSSPPPLDDDDDDDDDDDFGNFASAPHPACEDANILDVDSSKSDLSLPGDTFTVIKVESKSKTTHIIENVSSNSMNIAESSIAIDDGVDVIENQDDDFQDFAEFNDNPDWTFESEKISPIKKLSDDNDFHGSVVSVGQDSSTNHCVDKLSSDHDSSSLLTNNESVYSNTSTIDSGVFSTDLSPSTQPSNVLTQSSDFSNFEKQGVFVQSLEEASHADTSTRESQPALSDDCQVFQSADSNAEDWSDFNAAFESADKETIKSAEDTEGYQMHFADNVVEDEIHVSQSVSLRSENAILESISTMETDVCSSLVASSADISNGCEEKTLVVQSVSLISPENGTLEPISTKESLDYSSLVASSTDVGNDASETYLDSQINQLEIEPEVGNVKWSEFDRKTSDEAADVVVLENNPDSLHDSVPTQQSGDVLNEKSSQHISDVGNSIETEDSLLTASDFHLAADQEVHLHDDAEDICEFGSFSTAGIRKDSDPDKEVAPITFRTSICEAEGGESSSDEFGFTGQAEFKASALQNGEDDFGDFDDARHVEQLGDDDDDDDEFGEFGSAAKSKCETDIGLMDGASMQQEVDNDWADFDAASPAQPMESYNDIPATQDLMSRQAETYDENKTQKWEKVIISCFPEISEVTLQNNQDDATSNEDDEAGSCDLTTLDTVVELGLSNPLEAKQQSWTVIQHPSKKDPKVKLWSGLKDVDSSHALLYTWSTSHCSKEVFLTLHIDTQNVLFTQKKQAVPFFASGLNLLEPIRGGAESKNNKHISPAMLLDTNRPDITQNVTSVQDIPPVDFDWSSSGLTNPLAANTLDLDFLVVQGSDSNEKTSVFKADSQESTRSSLQPLEDILKKSTPTAKLATFETLSPEALRILDRMPDLSFMHSRVLMFPVKQ